MEAAVSSLAGPGDGALAIVSGKFGERWAQIAQALGLHTDVLSVEWGRAVDPAEVARRLDKGCPRLVLATHVETSTGVLHPIEELARLTREREALLVVDAVSALGGHPLEMDEWGVDAVICGSQKVLSLPTGLGLVALGERALGHLGSSSLPSYSLDLARALSSWEKDDFPFSPSVPLVTALSESLGEFLEPGIELRWARFELLSRVAQGAAVQMGFQVFPRSPARTLTTLVPPKGISPKALLERMERAFGIRAAGGQGRLQGKILRLGHMGHYGPSDLLAALGALQGAVRAEGWERPWDLGPWAQELAEGWAAAPGGAGP
jgi:aspartate aminotransferase-like enzyme